MTTHPPRRTALPRSVHVPDEYTDIMLQCAPRCLMVPPTHFHREVFGDEVKEFVHDEKSSNETIHKNCMAEHAALVQAMRDAKIDVVTYEQTDPKALNALFPNNVFSTHDETDLGEKAFVMYPMHAKERQREHNAAMIKFVRELGYPKFYDMTSFEVAEDKRALEGTGALVLDRIHKVAYCNLSHRANETLAKQWAHLFEYRLVSFWSLAHHSSIYHTNVMIFVGASVAVVCFEVMVTDSEREFVRTALSETHELIEISKAQLFQFCCNMLQLRTTDNRTVIVMSQRAYEGFTAPQLDTLRKHCDEIVHVPLTVIEDEGGGSARCLIAELF